MIVNASLDRTVGGATCSDLQSECIVPQSDRVICGCEKERASDLDLARLGLKDRVLLLVHCRPKERLCPEGGVSPSWLPCSPPPIVSKPVNCIRMAADQALHSMLQCTHATTSNAMAHIEGCGGLVVCADKHMMLPGDMH